MPTMVRVQCSICQKEYEIELKRYNQKIKENSAFYCSSDCRSHKGSILCNVLLAEKKFGEQNLNLIVHKLVMFIVVKVVLIA